MSKFIVVTVDSNDADYVSEVSEITNEQIKLIRPIIDAIKQTKTVNDGKHYQTNFNYRPVNKEWNDKNVRAEELYGHLPNFELFLDFCPISDEVLPYGFHTIKSIQIMTLTEILFKEV